MKRTMMGWIGGALAAVYPLAVILSGWAPASESAGVAICFRVGLLMLAVALAWPQLEVLWRKIPDALLGLAGLLVLLVVIRPRLIGVALAIAAVGLAVHLVLRRWSRVTRRRR